MLPPELLALIDYDTKAAAKWWLAAGGGRVIASARERAVRGVRRSKERFR